VRPLRLFVLAGEPSGDRIAADLVRRLHGRVPLDLAGVGGDELEAAGLKSLFPMSDLAVMGISDVVRRLPLLLWRIEQTARAIRRDDPDIVVLVDSQDFSRLLAKRLKSLGYGGRMILYVAPSVWARAPDRAAALKPLFDEVLAVLPFEPAVMRRLGGPPTCYVGHPALQEALDRPVAMRGPLVLLPGSREGELRRHLPLFRQVAERHAGHASIDGIVLPTLKSLRDRIKGEVEGWSVPVEVVTDRAERSALYGRAVMALAVSGTVTLELALARLPMVVSYVMDRHQANIYARLGSPAVSLPNIVLRDAVVPELVQAAADADALGAAVGSLLDDVDARYAQARRFADLVRLMEMGEADDLRQDPADRILAHWAETSGR
jgi:lipid-A-disaccharide synthase